MTCYRHRALVCAGRSLLAMGLLLPALTPLAADQIRFDTAAQWRQWKLPGDAVEIAPSGRIRPARIRRGIDAVRDAAAFGGGIRDAGSDRQQAGMILDGDPESGWAPDPEDPPADWYVEIDLGRAVTARRVVLLFDPAFPPFELFSLFLSTGEPAIDVVGTAIEGSLIYRIHERFKENDRHRVSFELDPDRHNTLVRYVRLQALKLAPGARLVEMQVEAIGDNIALGLVQRGGGLDIVLDVDNFADHIPLGNALAVADGDFSIWYQHRRINRKVDVISHMTLDLGGVYWVDLVRIIGDFMATPGSASRFNFDAYQVFTSDGSLAADGTRIWHRHFAGRSTDRNRQRGLAEHFFPLQPTRFVRVAWVFWDAACAAACIDCGITPPCQFWGNTREFQVYGEGYPARLTLGSPLIDLQGDKQINALSWRAEAPPGTRVEMRSRSGDQLLARVTYYDKNLKEVTEQKWNKLITSFRGPVDTTFVPGSDWSPWSDLYLSSGQVFQSPSPRRFAELELSLVSADPDRAAALDEVVLEFTEPLATRVLGEIYPVEVEAGAPVEFSYFLRPQQVASTGFDRLQAAASADLQFKGVSVDGQPMDAALDTIEAGFQITLARPVRSEELVELRFTSAVFVDATRFSVFLADSRMDSTVRQRVDPGDASQQVESSTDVVRLPVGGGLFAGFALSSNLLTPNGDGANDFLRAEVDLVNLLEPRPLHLRLYDLSGRRVYERQEDARAGRLFLQWDGRDESGRLLPPGLYLLELSVSGDAREQSLRRAVAIAY